MKKILLFTIIMFTFTVMNIMAQTTRYVPCGANTPCYATIQAAIDASVAGDIINVAAGTYAGNITVNKSTIITGNVGGTSPGPGVNAPIIDGGGAYTSAFFIANGVTNVTIQGFEMRNFASNSNGVGNGISAWVTSTSNITIQHNYFHNLGWDGVMVGNSAAGDHTNWLIANNILETFKGYGFEYTNTSNSSIQNNIIHSDQTNNPYDCIMIQPKRNETGISVLNNTIDGWFNGQNTNPVIYITDNNISVTLSKVTIQNNSIHMTGVQIDINVYKFNFNSVFSNINVNYNYLPGANPISTNCSYHATMDFTNNYYGTPDGPKNGSSGNNKFNILTEGGMVAVSSWLYPFCPWWKDISGTPGSYTGTSFAPITNNVGGKFSCFADAISGTSANGTLSVATGTFAETVTIPTGKPLTIQGQGGTAYVGYSGSACGLSLSSHITFSNFAPYSSSTAITINSGGIIQDGVDFAVSGSAVKVINGTWSQDVSVPAGKPITLKNSSGTTPVLIAASKTLTLASPVTFIYFSAATSGTLTQINPGGVIQNGIDFAASGGTVNVSSGTYSERLNISKSLTLKGAQFGVDPTLLGSRTNILNESIIDITGLAVTNPNVAIEIPTGTTNVIMDGFSIIGSPTFHYADEAVIRTWDNNITISNNIINGFYGLLYKGG